MKQLDLAYPSSGIVSYSEKKVLTVATTWMNLEKTQRGISQTHKGVAELCIRNLPNGQTPTLHRRKLRQSSEAAHGDPALWTQVRLTPWPDFLPSHYTGFHKTGGWYPAPSQTAHCQEEGKQSSVGGASSYTPAGGSPRRIRNKITTCFQKVLFYDPNHF